MAEHVQVNVGVNASQFHGGLASMRQGVARFSSDVRSQLLGAITAFGALSGAVSLFKKAVAAASNMQQLQAAFKTLLGSGEAAKKLLKDLADLAGRTPLGMAELAESAKKLLAFGEDPEGLIKTLEMLGDVAAGTGAPLEEIASMYGKMRVQGTLYAEDLNQLLDRGIPILTLLAERFGVAESAVKKMASEGKVSFADLEASLKKLTSAGGDWAGMMSEQAKTLAGKLAALEDAFNRLLVAFASPLLDAFAKKADGASDALSRWEGRAEGAGNILRWLLNIIDLAIVGLDGLAKILVTSFTGALKIAAEGVGGLSQAMSELFIGNFAKAAETAKKTAEDLAKIFKETLQESLDQAVKSGQEGSNMIADMQRGGASQKKQDGEGESGKKAAKKAPEEERNEQAEKLKKKLDDIIEKEADHLRNQLQGQEKINELIKERNRLLEEHAKDPQSEKGLDAFEKALKLQHDLDAETKRQDGEEVAKQDRIDSAKKEYNDELEQMALDKMTPEQRMRELILKRDQLDKQAKEEPDEEKKYQLKSESLGVQRQINGESEKMEQEKKAKQNQEIKAAEDAFGKSKDHRDKLVNAAVSVPVSSLQAVGGGGRAGPGPGMDQIMEAKRQTKALEEMVNLLRQQAGKEPQREAPPAYM